MGGLLHLVQREGNRAAALETENRAAETELQAAALSSPLLAAPNVTAHPSTASVPISVFLYDGPLLCRFNVPIRGLTG